MAHMERPSRNRVRVIQAQLGTPFHLPLDENREDLAGRDRTFPFTISEVGRGRVSLVVDSDMDQTNSHVPIRTPAGPVEVVRIINNPPVGLSYEARFSADRRRSPVTLSVGFSDIPASRAEGLAVALQYNRRIYHGEVLIDGGDREHIDVLTYSWAPSGQKHGELVFPQKPSILRHIGILINRK